MGESVMLAILLAMSTGVLVPLVLRWMDHRSKRGELHDERSVARFDKLEAKVSKEMHALDDWKNKYYVVVQQHSQLMAEFKGLGLKYEHITEKCEALEKQIVTQAALHAKQIESQESRHTSQMSILARKVEFLTDQNVQLQARNQELIAEIRRMEAAREAVAQAPSPVLPAKLAGGTGPHRPVR
jgi:chromosome segregation ATPase